MVQPPAPETQTSTKVPRRMIAKGLGAVALGLASVLLIFFVYKNSIVGIKDVPDYLIYLSLVGVLIYVGAIAADKTPRSRYGPGGYLPDYVLRITEAPVFISIIYLLILQNVPALDNTAALSALAIYTGMFTRNLEEFFKAIGKALLAPLETYVEKGKQAA